ncbi:hypothetical protein E4U55_002148 [Claviceps digitariae]|nr:hypothetical protein E4U55_002148 [Claviceps digitariae]
MVNHRAQAQFERAKWRRTILFPNWTLQLLLTVSMMGLFSWRLGDTLKHYAVRDQNGKAPGIEVAWEVTNVVMSFIAATCTLAEIVKYMGEALTPWTMLFTHVVKLTCASAICILDAVVYARRKEYQSLVSLGLDIGLFITSIALAIYAALTYRRLSHLDDYILPMNVKAYGFNDGDDRNPPYSGRLSVRNSIHRMVSMGSRPTSTASVTNEPLGLQTLQTTQRTLGYYSHERDTQFDEYLARRSSLSSLRVDLERGSSLEYRRGSFNNGVLSPTDASSSLVVPGGLQSRSRRASIARAVSYTSDHLLVAVPEEEAGAIDIIEAGARHGHDEMSLERNDGRLSSDEHLVQAATAVQEVDMTGSDWQREG